MNNNLNIYSYGHRKRNRQDQKGNAHNPYK